MGGKGERRSGLKVGSYVAIYLHAVLYSKPDLSTIMSGSSKPRSMSDELMAHSSTTLPAGGGYRLMMAESDTRPHMEEIFFPSHVAMSNGVGG